MIVNRLKRRVFTTENISAIVLCSIMMQTKDNC
jgi:hypothetical protein